jgi:Flp pilus assembly protein TadD
MLGRAGEALGDLERAGPMLAALVPVNGRRLRFLATKATALAALGRSDEARASAREALTLAQVHAALEERDWSALQALAR